MYYNVLLSLKSEIYRIASSLELTIIYSESISLIKMLWTCWIYLFYGGWLLDIFSINWHIHYLPHSGFYPSTFLQPVNGSKISILNWVLKLNLPVYARFFVCLSRKTLDRFFILSDFLISNSYKTNRLN